MHRNAVEGLDFDLDKVTRLWGRTLPEDKEISEDNRAGVASPFYRSGLHSREENFDEFIGW